MRSTLQLAVLRSGPRAALSAALTALLLASATAWAADAPLASAEPELDKRVMAVAVELRCLVCQNQTIADSNAELAVDLRNQVREMLRKGQSEREIIDYMTARYGDFVLYRPPVKSTTALLWFGPPVLLGGALLTLWLVLRRRSRLAAHEFEPDAEDGPDDLHTATDEAARRKDTAR